MGLMIVRTAELERGSVTRSNVQTPGSQDGYMTFWQAQLAAGSPTRAPKRPDPSPLHQPKQPTAQ